MNTSHAARLLGFMVFFSGAAVAQTNVPNVFVPGEPARASEVNGNFSALLQGIQSLESSKVNGSCSPGSFVSAIDESGVVTCDPASGEPPTPPVIGLASIEGFEGDSTISPNDFNIRELSFSAAANRYASRGGTNGAPRFDNVRITVKSQAAIPKLFELASQGGSVPEVIITLLTVADEPRLTLRDDVLVTSVIARPARFDGEPTLYDVTFTSPRIEFYIGGYEAGIDIRSAQILSACPIPDPLQLVNEANASQAKDVPLVAADIFFDISKPFDYVIGKTPDEKATRAQDLRFSIAPIPEAACFFGGLFAGQVVTSVLVQDYSVSGGGARSEYEIKDAMVAGFELTTNAYGQVRIKVSFDFASLKWRFVPEAPGAPIEGEYAIPEPRIFWLPPGPA